jgi:hypothetical protein
MTSVKCIPPSSSPHRALPFISINCLFVPVSALSLSPFRLSARVIDVDILSYSLLCSSPFDLIIGLTLMIYIGLDVEQPIASHRVRLYPFRF